jgi:hypothetical protein
MRRRKKLNNVNVTSGPIIVDGLLIARERAILILATAVVFFGSISVTEYVKNR